MKHGSISYRFTSFVFRRILYRITVEGRENEPQGGAVILCSNHISNSDPIFISAVTKRIARFMAKKELFSIPILKGIIRSFGAFPVNRGHADTAALKHSLVLLSEGDMLGIFPQGTRRPGVHPSETQAKTGLGMLAVRSKATILPVCVITKHYKVRFRTKIIIRIGKPIPPEEYCPGEPCVSEYERISNLAFTRICALSEPMGGRPKGSPKGSSKPRQTSARG